MAHGVEARVPYLDPAVVSAALRVPLRFNYRNGERKSLFKAVASRYLPQRFVTSRKKGFSSPLGSWFDPSFTAWADSVIDGGYLLDTGILRRDWRERLADATGHAVAGSRAASLLLTGELWARRWLDPNAASPLECAT
jgi:asparagine synthase (glutamine-hydrolysing)